MAARSRSTAGAISSISNGSCSSASDGARKRLAATASASPRWQSTAAAGTPMPKAWPSAAIDCGSHCGSSQRLRGESALVFGEVAAEGVIFARATFHGNEAHDFVLESQELLIPVRLHFIDVVPSGVFEGNLDVASHAGVLASFAQPCVVVAAIFAIEFHLFDFALELLNLFEIELTAGKQDELDVQLIGDAQEDAVI